MTEDIQSPARITEDHVQDRIINPAAGAPQAYRRLDGLAWLMERKVIAGHQLEAGRRLQDDYQLSQMEGGARSGGERTSGGRSSYDIPEAAHAAGKRVKEALAILTPETLTMTMLFLLPDYKAESPTLENIAARVGEHKRSVTLGIRTALSLLARHYGN